jgi:dTDP-4-dehydrorhamnose reductase
MTPRGRSTPATPLQMWGGIECTVNRVGDRWFDQVSRTGHDARIADLVKFASLGITAIRYPVLWERLAPNRPDEIDWRWTDERLSALQRLNVRPIAGLLHHGSGPRYTSLVDERFPELFAEFAGAVARRYPWVTDFTPINEPLTTARFSGLYGHWYPHHRSDRSYVRALLNQLRATVLAMRAIRKITPEARLIQTEDCGRTYGTPATMLQVEHELERRWLTWDLLTGRVDRRHPLSAFLRRAGMTTEEERFFLEADCPPDILGLNYYVTSDRFLDERIDRYPPEACGGNDVMCYADVEAVRVHPEGIAGHLRHLLSAKHRYGLPVAITEVHIACTRDEQLRWLWESWQAAEAARKQGVDVRAVTAWALLGSYDWDSLVTTEANHYEPGVFDARSPEPRPTALATLVRQLAAGETPSHSALSTPGWWHRPERLIYEPPSFAGWEDSRNQPLAEDRTECVSR